MQVPRGRRPNRQRSDEMRQRLLTAARALFIEKSFADTGTPEIVAAAGVTRGALYHHFPDKKALLQALLEAEAAAVAARIERADRPGTDPLRRLLDGSRAYLRAMRVPGRTRLLLLDGPAVMGSTWMQALDAAHARRTLREGLAAAIAAGVLRPLPLDPLVGLLSAMFDGAALAAEQGQREEDQMAVITALLEGIATSRKKGGKVTS